MNYHFTDLESDQFKPFSLTIDFHDKKELVQFREILYNHFHTGLYGQQANIAYWDEIMKQLWERYDKT